MLYDQVGGEVEARGSVFQALNGHIYGGNNTMTLILAHGFGADQAVWQYMIPTLAYFFKVVVFDLAFARHVRPGFYNPVRYSNYAGYADDLVSIVDELGVLNAIYVGHSMSAMIGCLALTRRPHAFKKLIFIGGSPRYLNANRYNGGFDQPELESLFKQIRYNYKNWAYNFAPKPVMVPNRHAVAYFRSSLLEMNPEITLSVAKTVFLSDLRWILPRVGVSTTIIQSKQDIVVPDFVARYMKNNLRGKSVLKVLPTKGHFPQLTATKELLSLLKEALVLDQIES